MAEFLLPKLGADMSRGRLVEWVKKPGERIARGEVIAVIETDKANVEVEAFASGTLERVLVEPGDEWLPVGTPLAVIGAAAGTAAAPRAAEQPAPRPEAAPAAQGRARATEAPPKLPPATAAPSPTNAPASRALTPPAPPIAEGARLRVSPVARRRAAELGVDLAALPGTGPHGRIVLADVEAAARAAVEERQPERPAPAAPLTAAEQAQEKRARVRAAIAAAMARAKREIPHYYLGTTIDLTRALAWLAAYNAERPVAERMLYGVLLLKAVAAALREHPELNGFWREGRAELADAVHLGVAISLRGGGLVAPALHDADKLALPELMRRLQDLVTRARAGSLRSSEMTDATVTVTSLGERGVEAVYGVIYPPQLALVGFGKVVTRPWVADGRVAPREVVTATLSADHRASDGHRGALFLDALDRLLQEPESL
ncbi:MAG: 2-oxo acid dehydrogenase subunit E2 [Burkholderiales bacterium]|nr:2-oxo acid dehydrogenase subunit E2 [Burkholderiales bacterium]